MDFGSVDRYVDRLIRAEKKTWGKGALTKIPEVDLKEINDEQIRREVCYIIKLMSFIFETII